MNDTVGEFNLFPSLFKEGNSNKFDVK
jgi:hypothetical protein